MTDEELLLDACYAYEDLAGLGGMTDKHREAYKKIRARLADHETPYQIGARLFCEGKGISFIPTAVQTNADITEALRGFEDARLAQPEPWVKTYSGNKPNYTEPCERCGEVNPAEIHTCTPKESFEYWNAVEGWVKIEEVRQHFDTAGCGTIYKTGGEGRVPLYTTPQREWVGLTDEEILEISGKMVAYSYVRFAKDIEAKLKEKNGG